MSYDFLMSGVLDWPDLHNTSPLDSLADSDQRFKLYLWEAPSHDLPATFLVWQSVRLAMRVWRSR